MENKKTKATARSGISRKNNMQVQRIKRRGEHGGSFSEGKRRSRRAMNTKKPIHVTLKSNIASGERRLFKHRRLILKIMKRSQKLFNVKVYNYSICGNHLHLLISGVNRKATQNFFRVFAGHIVQEILRLFPIPKNQNPNLRAKQCKKNQRKFWSYLLYTRIVSWGWDFECVWYYIERNILETFGLIDYKRTKKGHSKVLTYNPSQ